MNIYTHMVTGYWCYGSGVEFPRSPSTFRDLFLGHLRSTQLVHLCRAELVSINVGLFPARTFGFNCEITSGKGYVCTSCPSLPS